MVQSPTKQKPIQVSHITYCDAKKYLLLFATLPVLCLTLLGIVDLETKSLEYKDKVALTRAAVKEIEGSLKAHKQQLAAWNKEICQKVCLLSFYCFLHYSEIFIALLCYCTGYCLTVLLCCCTTALLYYCVVMPLRSYATGLLYYSVVMLLSCYAAVGGVTVSLLSTVGYRTKEVKAGAHRCYSEVRTTGSRHRDGQKLI